ncbi:hypothetical protein JCM8097_003950 [Rhodosporidiobolus ruineniae]
MITPSASRTAGPAVASKPRPLRALHAFLRDATLSERCKEITGEDQDIAFGVFVCFAAAFTGSAFAFLIAMGLYGVSDDCTDSAGDCFLGMGWQNAWVIDAPAVARAVDAALRWIGEVLVLAPAWVLSWVSVALPFLFIDLVLPTIPYYSPVNRYLAGYIALTSLFDFSLLHFLLGVVASLDERLSGTDEEGRVVDPERQSLLARAEAAEEEVRRLRDRTGGSAV